MTQVELSRRWVALGAGAYTSALVLIVAFRVEAAPAGIVALLACLGAVTVFFATRAEQRDIEASWPVRALVLGLVSLLALRVLTAAAFSEDMTRFAIKVGLGVLLYVFAYWLLRRWI